VDQIEPVVLVLLISITALSILSRAVGVPYPVLMVAGGLVIGLVPGAPEVALDPDIVLVVFLPPLLYIGAFFTSLRDVRRDARVISLLSIGLVVATAAAVAALAHAMTGMPWAAAFTLGAIVSPTDPLAATQILQRLGAPRRITTVLEGEGLVNDAVALVLYRAAVGAAVSGTFSVAEAGLHLVLAPLGGVAIGLAVGWIIARVRVRIEDPPTEVTLSIITGYAAYLPAEAAGMSGVLAAVTAGVYLGWRSSEIASSETRLQGFSFWTITQFLLNAILFVLIGLQLPRILDELGGRPAGELVAYGAAASAAVIAARAAWIFGVTPLIRLVDRRPSQRARRAGWRPRLISSWAGMRGSVSLAAALAVPVEVDAGGPFPGRDLILFMTFAVILVTLLLQGLTLPALIRALGIRDDGEREREELVARIGATTAALVRIDELEAEAWTLPESLERMRRQYRWRRERFTSRADGDGVHEDQSLAYQRAVREVLDAQRQALVTLRNRGEISNEVMHVIERELDLEDSRLELPPETSGPRPREH
jgi:CPA1 family monovalent cation:H+ antiporter